VTDDEGTLRSEALTIAHRIQRQLGNGSRMSIVHNAVEADALALADRVVKLCAGATVVKAVVKKG